MARQPFLTRLAFGRSPFESSNSTTQTPEPAREPPSEEDTRTQAAPESNCDPYTQLYNEQGTPINPGAREHGRRLRQAQNDVLSAIGVVERRPSPSEDLPGAYAERLEQLENEDTTANGIAIFFTLAGELCVWWVGLLRDRISTFRIADTVPFSQIIASEYQLSGHSIVYAGFPARLSSVFSTQVSIYTAYVLRPFDRFFYATRPTRESKRIFYRWRHVAGACFRVFVKIAFYPFAYHANLQRIGLLPARPLLPSWRAFLPFSSYSPIRLPPLHAGLSVFDMTKALMTSPLMSVYAQQCLERYAYALIHEAIESTIFRPRSPDLPSPDDGTKAATIAILGLRQRSPSFLRNSINGFLATLGWGEPFGSQSGPEQGAEVNARQSVDVGGQRVTNINRLDIPAAHSAVQPIHGYDGVNTASVPSRGVPINSPTHPVPSPTASEPSQDGDDPRIRITSRGDVIHMEIHPQGLSSSRTELVGDNNTLASSTHSVASAQAVSRHHRVTQLSTEPAHAIGAICKSKLVGLVVLPLRIITFRLIASHYLAGGGHSTARPLYWVFEPLVELGSLNLQSAGMLLSRVALCEALDLAISLGTWGCQWAAITYAGKTFFGWGAL